MSFHHRAASIAVASFCALASFVATSPGQAQAVSLPVVTALNVQTMGGVPENSPAASAAPSAEAAPAEAIAPRIVADEPDGTPAVALTPAAPAGFATLAAAVAAQSSELDDRELSCLAAGVFFESHGEPLAGQLAVAHTILNRAHSGRFARSACGVLTQPGQFSFVRGGVVPSGEGRAGWQTAIAVAKVALRDLWESPAEGALYFHARRVAPGWRMQRVATIGNHVFYR